MYKMIRVTEETKQEIERYKKVKGKKSIDSTLLELLKDIQQTEADKRGQTVEEYRADIDKILLDSMRGLGGV